MCFVFILRKIIFIGFLIFFCSFRFCYSFFFRVSLRLFIFKNFFQSLCFCFYVFFAEQLLVVFILLSLFFSLDDFFAFLSHLLASSSLSLSNLYFFRSPHVFLSRLSLFFSLFLTRFISTFLS